MSTGKIQLRETQEFLNDYTPVYNAVMPLFLAQAQQMEAVVGKHDFKRLEAIGDLRAKRVTPKDSEMHAIAAREEKKSFKKYFNAATFVQSSLQSREGWERVLAQVLDENFALNDELFMYGDGVSDATSINNGLYFSQDPNHVTEASTEIASSGRLVDLHTKIVGTVQDAEDIAGQKTVILYGDTLLSYYMSLHSEAARAFRAVLQEATPGVEYLMMPKKITRSSENGWLVVNRDQIDVKYCVVPTVLDQGVDAKNMEVWANFLVGSSMVDVRAYGAIIRQPCTFAA